MKKLLSCILILCMILSLSLSSFATVGNENNVISKEEIPRLPSKFDITYTKDFYEQNGMVVYNAPIG